MAGRIICSAMANALARSRSTKVFTNELGLAREGARGSYSSFGCGIRNAFARSVCTTAEDDLYLGAPKDVKRWVIIGDLHGNLLFTIALWDNLAKRLGREQLHRSTVIFLGDYCDYGPHTSQLFDFLIDVKWSRELPSEEGAPSGGTHFLMGSHDFGMAAYLNELPKPRKAGFDLDGTRDQSFTRGFFPHEIPGGMHYAGRRWGGSDAYRSHTTFESYEAEYNNTLYAHDEFMWAVPIEHKQFLNTLDWVYDSPLPFPPYRLVCVHAGLLPDRDMEKQIAALRRRDFSASILWEAREDGTLDKSRIAPLFGGAYVRNSPPGDFYLVSGHHGCFEYEGNRVIIDLSNGHPTPDRRIQAFVLPERIVVT